MNNTPHNDQLLLSDEDRHLSFSDMYKKHGWELTPMSQSSRHRLQPGPLTQDAAMGLLGIGAAVKPETAAPQPFNREKTDLLSDVGAQIIMEGDKDAPFDVDQNNNERQQKRSKNNNNIEPTTTTRRMITRSKRVSLSPQPTTTHDITPPKPPSVEQEPAAPTKKKDDAVVYNPYAKKKNSRQAPSEEEEAQEGMSTKTKEYTREIFNNANKFNTFGKKGDDFALAESNTEKYAKKVKSTHERFIKIVADATDPKQNKPGDAVLHEMFTKKVPMKNGLTVDYLFYQNVSGEPNMHSRTLVDQALKIWTTQIKHTKTGKPLDTNSHSTYIRQLFSAFHARDVQFKQSDFRFQGGFCAVVKKDWNDKRKIDPSLGTKRTKAQFDEFVDEKFSKVIKEGIYKPFEDMNDLLKMITMELGRQFGIRGGTELTTLRWSFIKMGTFKYGHMKDLKYAIIAPGGGFNKSHQLTVNNPTVTKQFPMVVEDPYNATCVVKLIFFYRLRCKPEQVRFFCHVNSGKRKDSKYYFKPRSPVGQDSIRKWVKEFAEVADFKDWEKYTPHDNRHRCCTILASDLEVPEKVRMDHLRHKHAKSSNPYIHQNSKVQQNVQGSLSSGLHREKKLPQHHSSLTNSKTSPPSKPNKENVPPVNPPDPKAQDVVKAITKPLVASKKTLVGAPQSPISTEPSPSKDELKKEVQKRKRNSKDLKKENKKQRSKLDSFESKNTRLTVDLKASKNLVDTLTTEVENLYTKVRNLTTERDKLRDDLRQQKRNNSTEKKEAVEMAKKEVEDSFKLNYLEWKNEKARMEADHKNQISLLETKLENEQRLKDLELKGKQNELDQLHRQQMDRNNRFGCNLM